MNFAKMLAEQDQLTRGNARIHVEPRQDLRQFAEAISEQGQDLMEVMSEMTEEDLLDFTEALDEAIIGVVNAGECMEGLTAVGKILSESEDPEQQKIYPVVKKARGGLADLGKILMTLKKAATRANEAS